MRLIVSLVSLAWIAGADMAVGQDRDSQNIDWRSIPLVEDGRVAPGWKFTGYGGFEIVDGALKTVPDERGLGLLVYAKEKFGDCRIRVVFRAEEPRDNSGVYVRIDDGILDQGQPPAAERNADGSLTAAGSKAMEDASAGHLGPWYAVHHGYEIQICEASDPLHTTGSVYSLAEAAGAPGPPAGGWRTMVITLDGERIEVEIDGTRVTTFDPAEPKPERRQWYEPERDPERPTAGYLGLQTHDPGDTVFFKEVSIAPLAGGR